MAQARAQRVVPPEEMAQIKAQTKALEAAAKAMSLYLLFAIGFKGGVSVALQAAQAKLISQQQTAHPFFWAAFVVVGDGMAASSAQLLKPPAALASR